MKIPYDKFAIMALILAAMCWASAPTFAQHPEEHGEQEEEGEHHEGGHDSDVATPKKAHDIVAAIFARDLLIQNLIETGQLTKIHKPAFEAKDLVESLVKISHSDHESSSGKKLSAASKKLGASAKLLDKYGDAKDAAKTGSAYKAFGATIKDIRTLYPKVTPKYYWTCSMHPDVWKAATGTCPKCKMKLVEKGKPHDGEKEEQGHPDGHENEH